MRAWKETWTSRSPHSASANAATRPALASWSRPSRSHGRRTSAAVQGPGGIAEQVAGRLQQVTVDLVDGGQVRSLLHHVADQRGAPFQRFDQPGESLVGSGQPGGSVGCRGKHGHQGVLGPDRRVGVRSASPDRRATRLSRCRECVAQSAAAARSRFPGVGGERSEDGGGAGRRGQPPSGQAGRHHPDGPGRGGRQARRQAMPRCHPRRRWAPRFRRRARRTPPVRSPRRRARCWNSRRCR